MTAIDSTRRPAIDLVRAMEPGTYSIRETAQRLGISADYAYRLARIGELPVPVLLIGNLKRVRRSDIESLLAPTS
jgi:excisionase family DNA binding protein